MKFIKVFLLFLLFTNITYGQYRIGVYGGLGISDLTGSDFSKVSDPKLGIDIRLFYERELNPTLSLTFELSYNQKGSKYEFYPVKQTTVFVDVNSEYINLPLYLKAYFGSKAGTYIYTGLSYSRLLKHSISHSAKDGDLEINSDPFFPYKMNKYDVSVNLGFGFAVYKFLLDLRYCYGLVNIYEGVESPVIRNHFLSATLGYTFYRKKVYRCLGGSL